MSSAGARPDIAYTSSPVRRRRIVVAQDVGRWGGAGAWVA